MTFYSEPFLEAAFSWLCRQRKDYHFNNDVWHLRFHWQEEKEKLVKSLEEETFRFRAVKRIRTPERDCFLWDARDALVLKAIALYLEDRIRPKLSKRGHMKKLGSRHQKSSRC